MVVSAGAPLRPGILAAVRGRVFAHRQSQSRNDRLYFRPSGEGDFEAQVEQVFANLKIAVEAAGGVMAAIVKLNYFLAAEVDQADVPKMRPIRDRYLNVAKPPASTFVVVSRLMRPGWLIEIEAVAAIDD